MEIKINNNKPYDIFIKKEAFLNLNHYLDKDASYFLITDSQVADLYLKSFLKQRLLPYFIVEAGEKSKSLSVYQKIMEWLLVQKADRKSILIAFGGGVIGDLVGFVASSYLRGVSYISIPTTTIAMLDSSIGSKTGLNHFQHKNMIGSFWSPSLVIIDPWLLETLGERDYYSGLVEALKMGLLADEKLYRLIINGDFKNKIEEIIKRSLLVKKSFVEADEYDLDIRTFLNLGHTLGHIYESLSNYSLKHGEAILNGLFKVIDDKKIIVELLEFQREYNLQIIDAPLIDQISDSLQYDKKIKNHKLTFIRLKKMNYPYKVEVDLRKEKELEIYV